MSVTFDKVFSGLPTELRERLEKYYLEIKRNFARGHYEPAELNGGKFCEIVFRTLEWHTDGGVYTPLGTSKMDFAQATRRLENKTAFPDSIRFHIPQVLNAIYPIRNKRGVAHHAGEIDSNRMDATFVVASVDWVMAELVRIFHGVSINEAQALVESLTTKQIPLIWQIGDHHRVISPPGRKLTASDKILLLLYNAYPASLGVSKLLIWTEYDPKNKGRFRNTILKGLHKDDLIHLNESSDEVHLSPLGIEFVEKKLPLNF